MQDPTATPTETPTQTPTNPPSPTPIEITPYPVQTVPAWSTIEGEITSSDINAYDCGPGHDGKDHLYAIAVETPSWFVIEARVKNYESSNLGLDLDYGLQVSASGTPHETLSDIGCWDYSGGMTLPTSTPTGILPTPTPTSTSTLPEDSYGMYWSHFLVRVYNTQSTEYFFWIGGHTEEDTGDYQLRVYYVNGQVPTPTLTPEPSCTPSTTP